ncbi:MAG: hypothetical protein ACR2H3_10300 [Acidimicrobiales bacterium]
MSGVDLARPSSRWYRVGAAVVIVGLIASVGWWVHATTQVHKAVGDLRRLSPFGGVIELPAGEHTFWIEGECLTCRGNSAAEYRAAATASVTGPSGQSVALVVPGDERLFNTGGDEGKALWWFEVTEAGPHRVALGFDTRDPWDNRLPAKVAIGRGHGLPARITRPMVQIAGLSIAFGSGFDLVIWWRRRRSFSIAAAGR